MKRNWEVQKAVGISCAEAFNLVKNFEILTVFT